MQLADSSNGQARDDALAQRVAEALVQREGTAPVWGLVLEEVRVGYARVRMRVRPDMLNGYGTAHGGMIFALADSAFAYACNSRNLGTVAQQASIAFLTPAKAAEVLIAEAREVAVAGRSGVYNAVVRTDDGRIVATFQGVARTVGGPLLKEDEHG